MAGKATPELMKVSREFVEHLIHDGADCLRCKHYTDHNTCRAFPDGIPDGIDNGRNHVEPYPGDNGIQFEDSGTIFGG